MALEQLHMVKHLIGNFRSPQIAEAPVFRWQHTRNRLGLILALSVLGTGCASATHYLEFSANSEPHATVHPAGTGHGDLHCLPYRYEITAEDKRARQVDLPPVTFLATGYVPYVYDADPIPLNDEFWKRGTRVNSIIVHFVSNPDEITLKEDPNYQGTALLNVVRVIINSEPQGAKIYERGKLIGTTPFTAAYTIDKDAYTTGNFTSEMLTVIKEGYLPREIRPEIKVQPEWKYSRGDTFESPHGLLCILRADPNHIRPVVVQQDAPQVQHNAPQQAPTQQTIVIKQDPHHGREYQTATRALGEIVRPYSIHGPAKTQQYVNALEGIGVLMDLDGDLDIMDLHK